MDEITGATLSAGPTRLDAMTKAKCLRSLLLDVLIWQTLEALRLTSNSRGELLYPQSSSDSHETMRKKMQPLAKSSLKIQCKC